MTVREVTYYEVHCDEPGCRLTSGDLSDYSAWSEKAHAEDNWTDAGGKVLPDGRTFCDLHSIGLYCGACDDELATETVEDEGLCAGCAEKVRQSDPTDAEMGGLASSWAHSRAVVAEHPDYTDRTD